MSAAPPISRQACPDCGADVPRGAGVCWLCHRQLSAAPDVIMAELVPERTKLPAGETTLGVLTAIVGFVVLLVAVGIGRDQPWLLVPYTLVVGMGLCITLVHELRARRRGRSFGWGERLVTFILTVHVIGAVLAVLMVAVVGAVVIYLFLVCTGGLPK